MQPPQSDAAVRGAVTDALKVGRGTNADADGVVVDWLTREAGCIEQGDERRDLTNGLNAQHVLLVGAGLQRSGEGDGATAQHDDRVTGAPDVIEDVRGDQDPHAKVVRDASDDVEHLGALGRVQTVGWLVEDDQLRRVDERLSELNALTHAQRERADHARALLLEADGEEHLGGTADRVGPRQATQLSKVADEVGGGQLGRQALVLWRVADPTADLVALGRGIVSEHAHRAGVKRHEAEDRFHQRRLACPVLAEQSGGGSLDADRHVGKCRDGPIALARTTHLDRRLDSHRERVRAIVDTARVELTAATLIPYLVARGALPAAVDCTVEPLGGGISNDVWQVRWADGCLVVKQALPFLRVAEVWAYDVGRSSVEQRALSELNRLLGPGFAPAVLFADDAAHVFGMTCAPAGGTPWKDLLLAGSIDLRDGYRAGDLLGRIHAASAADGAAADRFADQLTLIEGRIDPYHRAVATRHADLAALIEAEVERLLSTRRALVLGDYAPKNLIAYPDAMLVLDVEVAHWGDPAFDVAFCLNHLCLKALHLPRHRGLLVGLARAFYGAYREHAAQLLDDRGVVAELGILMVARVDGKSPAEYLDERSRGLALRIGRSLLLDPPASVMRALERVEMGAP